MGGRGTFSKGIKTKLEYETVGKIEDVKVLRRIDGSQGLPEESNTSNAYILLDPQGNFSRMRLYDENHIAYADIDYHREFKISGNDKKVLHIHMIGKDFSSRPTGRLLTKAEYEKYKKYLKGVKYE